MQNTSAVICPLLGLARYYPLSEDFVVKGGGGGEHNKYCRIIMVYISWFIDAWLIPLSLSTWGLHQRLELNSQCVRACVTTVRLEIHTNLYVEFQVLIHGKYMFENVLWDPGDDSHSLGIMKIPLREERDLIRTCEWRAGIKCRPWDELSGENSKRKESREAFDLKRNRVVSQREL